MLSGMFSFMKQSKRMRHSKDSEGIYLADLSSGNLDPEVTALYFPRKHSKQTGVYSILKVLLAFAFVFYFLQSFSFFLITIFPHNFYFI